MRQDFEKLFSHLKPVELPAGLFDRIILAIKQEQELQHAKKLTLGFLLLLIISLVAAPFSWMMLTAQIEDSGILYFISAAASDIDTFLVLWQDFILAVAESLPVVSIIIFVLNMILAIFTVRLFLYKKRLLLNYLLHINQI